MSTTKVVSHTPGPWRVAAVADYAGSDLNVDGGTRAFIATCGKWSDDEAEANARLIAAAPDLLALARYVWASTNVPEDMRQQARAAMAKAEGL